MNELIKQIQSQIILRGRRRGEALQSKTDFPNFLS